MIENQTNWLTRICQTMGGEGEGGTAYSDPGGLGRLMGGPYATFGNLLRRRRKKRKRHVIHQEKRDETNGGGGQREIGSMPKVRKTDPRGHMPD